MSDFDFDEIDKAVNGALGGNEIPVTRPAAVTSIQKEEVATAEVDQPAEESSAARSIPPAYRRSSGRFMDVMHPSSDMRTRNTTFVPPTPLMDEPDSSDNQGAQSIDETTSDDDTDWSQPLESPFLPDTKVEKRPLGGNRSDDELKFEDFMDEPEDELLEAPEETLMLEEPDEPRLEAGEPISPTYYAPHHEEEDLIDEDEPVGPTSIMQQYKEQPVVEQESGAIYDTESYHQAVSAEPNKRSSAWAVVWILALVILGAAAGVAFYMYVLPMF